MCIRDSIEGVQERLQEDGRPGFVEDIGHRLAVAEAGHVDGDRPETRFDQCRDGAAPVPEGMADAVEEQNRGALAGVLVADLPAEDPDEPVVLAQGRAGLPLGPRSVATSR